jgi:hypothetical protein
MSEAVPQLAMVREPPAAVTAAVGDAPEVANFLASERPAPAPLRASAAAAPRSRQGPRERSRHHCSRDLAS